MREQYELRKNVTDEVKLDIIRECVNITKTLKSMFGLVYKYGLDTDPSYLRREKKLAKSTLAIMDALVGDTTDDDVNEAKAYLTVLLREYLEEES